MTHLLQHRKSAEAQAADFKVESFISKVLFVHMSMPELFQQGFTLQQFSQVCENTVEVYIALGWKGENTKSRRRALRRRYPAKANFLE